MLGASGAPTAVDDMLENTGTFVPTLCISWHHRSSWQNVKSTDNDSIVYTLHSHSPHLGVTLN